MRAFPKEEGPFLPSSRDGAGPSTQGALSTYSFVMRVPLKSDGNRPYALGKRPALQGGMDE